MIKILLVDDHQIVRHSIRRLLSEVRRFKIVGEASHGEEAWELVTQNNLEVDVLLTDISMPTVGGFELTRRFLRKYPEIKIIVFTGFTGQLYPYHFLRLGVQGYVIKDCKLAELVEAIDKVYSGKIYFSLEITEQLSRLKKVSPFYGLSPTEMQMVIMLIENKSIDEIAKKLCLSQKTIDTYRRRMFKKLGVKNDVGLMRLVVEEGLLDVPNF